VADAQFAIDIAAEMPAGEATLDQLDKLTEQLSGAGRNSDVFQKAIQQTSNALDAATVASKAANVALSEGETEYRRLERAALQASKAAEKAAKKNEGVVPEDLAQKALASAQAVDDYALSLRKLENNAEKASGAQAKFSKQLKNVRRLSGRTNDRLGESATNIANLRGALGDIGGPAGELGEKLLKPVQGFTDLAEVMGRSKAAAIVTTVAIVGLTAVLAALAAIVVVVTGAVAVMAVALADSARSTGLAREAAEALEPKLAALSGTMDELERSTNVSGESLQKLSKNLIDAKVSAGELPAALRAAALAESALGQGGAASFIADIKAGRLEVGKFSNDAQQKFGGIVARQMLGLGAQATTLKRNFAELFGGLQIEPVLQGVQLLVALFDKTTVAGKAMKFLFESVFQPIIDQAENAALVVEAFALGFLIGLTKVFIAIKPAIKAVKDFFGFEDTSLSEILAGVTDAGEIVAFVFVGFVALLAVVATAVGLAVLGFTALAAGAVALVVALFKLGMVIGDTIIAMIETMAGLGTSVAESLKAAGNAVLEFFAGLDLAQIGTDLMLGLARGISAGAGFIKNAISKAISSAISSAKSLLGIASPSKVFAGIGENTGEGFAGGVEDTEDQAQDAMASLVEPPEAVAPEAPSAASLAGPFPAPVPAMQTLDVASVAEGDAPASSSKGGGGAPGVDLSGAQFIFNGVEGAEDAEQKLRETLTKILEGDATQLGSDEGAAA